MTRAVPRQRRHRAAIQAADIYVWATRRLMIKSITSSSSGRNWGKRLGNSARAEHDWAHRFIYGAFLVVGNYCAAIHHPFIFTAFKSPFISHITVVCTFLLCVRARGQQRVRVHDNNPRDESESFFSPLGAPFFYSRQLSCCAPTLFMYIYISWILMARLIFGPFAPQQQQTRVPFKRDEMRGAKSTNTVRISKWGLLSRAGQTKIVFIWAAAALRFWGSHQMMWADIKEMNTAAGPIHTNGWATDVYWGRIGKR